MQKPKDWTQQERDRFEKVFCAFASSNINNGDIQRLIEATEITIRLIDKHYKTTSNEQSNNNN